MKQSQVESCGPFKNGSYSTVFNSINVAYKCRCVTESWNRPGYERRSGVAERFHWQRRCRHHSRRRHRERPPGPQKELRNYMHSF